VTILGSTLLDVTGVQFFNGQDSTFNIVDDTRITCTVPAGATTGKISVTNPGGTTQTETDFTVDTMAPTVSITSPAGGETLGAGSTFLIKFDASDNDSVASIAIDLSTDGGMTFPASLASSLPGTS